MRRGYYVRRSDCWGMDLAGPFRARAEAERAMIAAVERGLQCRLEYDARTDTEDDDADEAESDEDG